MTAQITDTFLFKGKKYDLIGMTSDDLFSPEQFGIETEELHSACWRGFYAYYKLLLKGLYLVQLTVRDRNGNYPPIGGIEPEKDDYQATYCDLKYLVPFTGKIRLARGFIDEYYIHMGFQKPSAFKTVLDISLQSGRVININDRSEEMEQKRGAFKKRYDSENMLQGIHEAFSMDLDLE